DPGSSLAECFPARPVTGGTASAAARSDCAEVVARTDAIVAAAAREWSSAEDMSGPLDPTRFVADELAAAALVASPQTLVVAITWYRDMLASRAIDRAVLRRVLEHVRVHVADLPDCQAFLAACEPLLG
ncbi:MAG TPA: hypothetical protein PLS63_10535, partial [Microthrixaceae bacterium]|nr:hypothetical protein [Microthrixaceae bacterium]